MEPSFDAAAYVADLRRFVPLETLSTELDGHLTTLKNRVSQQSPSLAPPHRDVRRQNNISSAFVAVLLCEGFR